MMKRREFIAVVGGAAAAWPHAGCAQQSNQTRRIAVLMGPDESDPEAQSEITALRRRLQDLGWTAITCGSRIVGALVTPIGCGHLRKS
jgi:putative tryptophan/tyrosine transport system substrate-binding protein